MTIGELARSAGVGVETVRFYQRRGLVEQPPKRAGSRRVYSARILAQLRFVRRCVGIGVSLRDVGEILRWRRVRAKDCGAIHERLRAIGDQLEMERRAIEVRQKTVDGLLLKCVGDTAGGHCGIVTALEDEE